MSLRYSRRDEENSRKFEPSWFHAWISTRSHASPKASLERQSANRNLRHRFHGESRSASRQSGRKCLALALIMPN